MHDGLNWYTYCGGNPVAFIDPTGLWEEGDEKFSTTVQTMLLQLTYAWYSTNDQNEKDDIHNRAEAIREYFSNGLGKIVDIGKTITGAAADEFSWFLGGDVDAAERDYWLTQVNEFQEVRISEKKALRAIMFVVSIGTPSIDDAWKLISKKASKEMIETVGEKGAKKFLKALTKYAGKQGASGIKKLSGKGIKGFMYEVKIIGKNGAYRLLGNKNELGEIIWEVFEKTH